MIDRRCESLRFDGMKLAPLETWSSMSASLKLLLRLHRVVSLKFKSPLGSYQLLVLPPIDENGIGNSD